MIFSTESATHHPPSPQTHSDPSLSCARSNGGNVDTGGNNFRSSLPGKSCLCLAASPDDARCERSLAGSEGDDVRGWGPRRGLGERRAPGGAPRGRLHSDDARVRLVSHDRSQHRAAAAQPRAGRHAQAGRHRRLVRPFPDRSCCARALNETDLRQAGDHRGIGRRRPDRGASQPAAHRAKRQQYRHRRPGPGRHPCRARTICRRSALHMHSLR